MYHTRCWFSLTDLCIWRSIALLSSVCVRSRGSYEYNHKMFQLSAYSDLIWLSLRCVGASHGYTLKAYMNKHTLLNNVTSCFIPILGCLLRVKHIGWSVIQLAFPFWGFGFPLRLRESVALGSFLRYYKPSFGFFILVCYLILFGFTRLKYMSICRYVWRGKDRSRFKPMNYL
jgi:hypothetical protein